MDFGSILSDTWRITWKNKLFWILGILAGCSASGRGSNAQFSSGFRGWNFEGGDLENFQFNFEGAPELEKFFNSINTEAIIATGLVLFCIAVFFSLVFLVLGVIGQGGLIASFGQADRGVTLTLADAFNLGVQNFWKLLGIRLTVWIAGFIIGVVVLIAVIGIAVFTLGLGLLCLLPLLCLIIPLAIGVDSYITLTMVAAVEEGLGVFDAFGRAWEVLKENIGQVLIMALILVIGGGFVSFLLFAPIAGAGVPALIGVAIGDDAALATGIGATVALWICAFPFILLLQGIVTTYITGAWTLTYRRLTGEAAVVETA
jgi:hypothetical protein